MSRHEIRLSGSGGQGLITAGIIFANAAAIACGKNAIQSQSYGPEARGGASKAEVIISSEEINYPKVTAPDILVALTQASFDKYSHDLKDDAIVIVDSLLVQDTSKIKQKVYSLPIMETVTEKLGKALSANIATLAIVNEMGNILPRETLLESMLTMVPRGTEKANTDAYNIGIELAKGAK